MRFQEQCTFYRWTKCAFAPERFPCFSDITTEKTSDISLTRRRAGRNPLQPNLHSPHYTPQEKKKKELAWHVLRHPCVCSPGTPPDDWKKADNINININVRLVRRGIAEGTPFNMFTEETGTWERREIRGTAVCTHISLLSRQLLWVLALLAVSVTGRLEVERSAARSFKMNVRVFLCQKM